jgi:catechol 2,3-dioxygenase-like lactoylglutathione lyase family enzyme
MRWDFAVPQLPVRDVPASQRWYRHVLGFAINWTWEDSFGCVGKDDVQLFLWQRDDPQPVYVSLFVDDVDRLYGEVREPGGDISDSLESKPWGVQEFSMCDPDGNVLRIGTGERPVVEIEEFTVGEAR